MPLRMPVAAGAPPPVPGAPPPLGQYPTNFPATRGDLLALRGAGLNNLLRDYNLSQVGSVTERINRVAEHLGLSGLIA